jgi:hypothetical protein
MSQGYRSTSYLPSLYSGDEGHFVPPPPENYSSSEAGRFHPYRWAYPVPTSMRFNANTYFDERYYLWRFHEPMLDIGYCIGSQCAGRPDFFHASGPRYTRLGGGQKVQIHSSLNISKRTEETPHFCIKHFKMFVYGYIYWVLRYVFTWYTCSSGELGTQWDLFLPKYLPSADSAWCQGGATYWHLCKLNELELP